MGRLLALILLVGLACGESAIAQSEKHIGKGGESTQGTKPDERGTEASPLVVNEHAIQSKEESAEDARKDAEQNRVNGRIIALTTAIAICAGLQFLGILGQIHVYRQQTRLMLAGLKVGHKNAQAAITAANAASESAEMAQQNIDNFVRKDRPYIAGSPIFVISMCLVMETGELSRSAS